MDVHPWTKSKILVRKTTRWENSYNAVKQTTTVCVKPDEVPVCPRIGFFLSMSTLFQSSTV